MPVFPDFLRSIFSRSTPRPAAPPAPSKPVFKLTPAVNHGEIYIASHLVDIQLEKVDFTQRFGPDFNTFFYRPDVASFICQEVLAFRNPSSQYNNFLDHSHWADKHYLNFPGPFYTGSSDTCGTGECEAPANVLNDGPHAQEYVFRQPQTFAEFLCVLDAAAVEVLDSYSCDGNAHWTYQLCREWWRGKDEIIRRLQTPAFQAYNGDRVQLYLDYLNGAAETDLGKYCYFLEHGHYPSAGTALPPL